MTSTLVLSQKSDGTIGSFLRYVNSNLDLRSSVGLSSPPLKNGKTETDPEVLRPHNPYRVGCAAAGDSSASFRRRTFQRHPKRLHCVLGNGTAHSAGRKSIRCE